MFLLLIALQAPPEDVGVPWMKCAMLVLTLSRVLCQFNCVVLDEAHAVLNKDTCVAGVIADLQALLCWAITASPIHNTLDDIVLLLWFLRLQPYTASPHQWCKDIMDIAWWDCAGALRRLHAILAPITIWRGSSQLGLPPMQYNEIVLQPSELQKAFCDALLRYCEPARNYSMLVLMLINYMREAVCHPSMVINSMKRLADIRKKRDGNQEVDDDEEDPEVTANEIQCAIDRLMALSTDEGREDECCICMETEATLLATPCYHGCCAGCWEKIESYASDGIVRCPQCRAEVLGTAPREERVQVLQTELEVARAIPNAVDESAWDESCKIDYLLAEVKLHGATDKIIIVSQWGDVSAEHRTESIRRFQTNPDVRICLLSLNSSSEGITLTAATRMYILDPWWNPARDYQALHRMHRIGQTRPVTINAIYVADTVEDQIRTMRAAKGAIASATVGDGAPPQEFDWTQEAKIIFQLDTDDVTHRKRKATPKPPPKCAMPGFSSSSSTPSGFDAGYVRQVREEIQKIRERRELSRRPAKRSRFYNRPTPTPPKPVYTTSNTEGRFLTGDHPLFL
ncbi:helicase conserved Cterminal domain containing protein [Acanthamoeba castellanii str. Neff]|uniref:Helicase conserved Cterminal domain containing protein n=1 Tax=Acanthamoeba castellanii (strain ATCC 30010 / Neff) TaxID=1257118 RepID=L8HBP1_ACACF|nr:helicase conserved Cterminal domain containing protein [Acanthamoeba castellanii str. Neff]ELR21831.1 helicase conserved Cterminal domain containing protein [Acanthamoeba castellanii str. Neff]